VRGEPDAYRNPLPIANLGGEPVETFADPAVLKADDGTYFA